MIAGILLLILTACGRKERPVSKRDLQKYVNDPRHGLAQQTSVADVDVRLTFEPSDLLVAHDLVTGGNRDTVKFNLLQRKYSGNYYFLLRFSKGHKELLRQLPSFGEYSEMVEVLSFRMQQYVNLTTDRDTLPMSDYAYEQTYGFGDANTLLIAFPKMGVTGKDKFDVNLAECGFGIGSVKFSFRKADLEKVPELDYSKLN